MFGYAPIGKEPYTRCYRCGELLGMSRSVMYAYRPSPVNFVPAMVNWLGELRRELASRWSDGNQSYCQRCRKNSNWKDDLPSVSLVRPARTHWALPSSRAFWPTRPLPSTASRATPWGCACATWTGTGAVLAGPSSATLPESQALLGERWTFIRARTLASSRRMSVS